MTDLKEAKDIKKYIDKINDDDELCEMITMEHRSNNPKRDYLFVNKLQCKHIPSKPSGMISMCSSIAKKVNERIDEIKILKDNDKILVVGFAETATAIAGFVADKLKHDNYLIRTTREDINNAIPLLTFEEEHSHATTQMLYTYTGDEKLDINEFKLVLFIEDEISTGNTICNFINAFEKEISGLNYMVASVCNWQNSKDKLRFKKLNIETVSLISGELIDKNAKMGVDIKDNKINNFEKFLDLSVRLNFKHPNFYNIFEIERLGRETVKVNLTPILNVVKKLFENTNIKIGDTVRVVGTEEFMYIPILLAHKLEVMGLNILCHSTTRSKIDIIADETYSYREAIKNRIELPSAYEENRKTYLYNTEENTVVTILISDSRNEKQFNDLTEKLIEKLNGHTENMIAIRLA